jgi:hypothetical protein
MTAFILVPTCSDCNKYRLIHVAANTGEQTIHPYSDEVDKEQWLFGEIVESASASVRFAVHPPSSSHAVQAERLKTHFRTNRWARSVVCDACSG